MSDEYLAGYLEQDVSQAGRSYRKFGILGMVFAVPVAAIYRVLYKELWHAEEEQATNS